MARRNARKSGGSLGISLTPGWIGSAILLALLVHLGLFLLLKNTELRHFGEAYYEQIVPRSFKLDRVEIPAELLANDEQPDTPADQPPETREIPLPREQPEAVPPREVKITPEAEQDTTLAQALNQSAPAAAPDIEQAMRQTIDRHASSPSDSQLPEIDISDFATGDSSSRAPELIIPGATGNGSGVDDDGPEFTDLDQLVSATGPVASDEPILMDAGLLFDYDSALLHRDAARDLEKVATLIQRSPDSEIVIEGHTDSFGAEEYNLDLSRQRARSVKQWLVDNAGIAPARITIVGHGKRNLIAPAEGSIEEQQINRRVEITIRSPTPPR